MNKQTNEQKQRISRKIFKMNYITFTQRQKHVCHKKLKHFSRDKTRMSQTFSTLTLALSENVKM